METATESDSYISGEVIFETNAEADDTVVKQDEVKQLKEEIPPKPPEDFEDTNDDRKNQCEMTLENSDNTSAIDNTNSGAIMEVETTENDSESVSEQLSTQSGDTPPQASTSAMTTNEKRPREISETDSPCTPSKIEKLTQRATRSSQNPDFAAKQRKFLNRVHDPIRRDTSDSENSQGSTTLVIPKSPKENKPKSERKGVSEPRRRSDRDLMLKRSAETDDDCPSRKKRFDKEPTKVREGRDSYCFRCHKDGTSLNCRCCVRVYHVRCIQLEVPPEEFTCPECITVTSAENYDRRNDDEGRSRETQHRLMSRSKSMQLLTVDQLCNLLRYALNRMKDHEGSEDFEKPVDLTAFPNYRDYIVKPMDLSQMEQNIKQKTYGSTEAFLADTKWIVHNSIIFNSAHSKFTNTARALFKKCRQEMQEIENCPDCYQNAHTRATDSWFIEACRRPHILVWAKLKGFPFWPAKAMQTNSDNQVDVRFFGAHDRAWVPLKDVFLYSKLSPAPSSNKNKRNLEECLQELELHIKKLRDKFGQFEYAPYKTPYDPTQADAQLAIFLPKYQPLEPGKRQARISLHQDGARKSLKDGANTQKPRQDTARKSIQHGRSSAPRQERPPSSQKDSRITTAESSVFDASSFEDVKPNKAIPGTKGRMFIEFSSDESPPSKSPTKESTQQQMPAQDESEESSSAPGTPGTPHGMRKHHKTPLTAAAKKCFAMNKKFCSKCRTNTSAMWHRGQNGDFFCTDCISSQINPTAKSAQSTTLQGKSCALCLTHITMMWLTNHDGLTVCSSCGFADNSYKKDERAGDPNSTIRGTVTVQRKRQLVQDVVEKLPDLLGTTESDTTVDEQPSGSSSEEGTAKAIDDGAAGDVVREAEGEPEPGTPNASGDAPVIDFPPVDSPPKFIIPKACGSESPDSTNKVSIVDRLKEKLCFAVEEALHLSAGEESGTAVENNPEEPVLISSDHSGEGTSRTELKKLQILLHDVRSDKEIMETVFEQNANQSVNKSKKDGEVEVQSLSETGSEPDSDVSSSLESDSSSKRKKQKNINNVVKNLKERKGSVDERNDQTSKVVESSAVVLDDSSNESPVLTIDESELSDNKKSPGKPDKSRRKGIPAKVFSRSSTSTESLENSPNESRTPKKTGDVLDEVSGQFRRSSVESNLTITLVTDSVPEKKTPKEVRSVNISKSLSLSVVNDSSGLEMECVEDDLDDPVIVGSVLRKGAPKPTARKTLPNPPKSVVLTQQELLSSASTSNKSSQLEVLKVCTPQTLPDPVLQPPPLVNIRQAAKVYGPSKAHSNPPVSQYRPSTPRAPTPVTPTTANDVQLPIGFEQAFKKAAETLRSSMEDMLKDMMECGSMEAKVKFLELELEKMNRRYRSELQEIKHNSDLWMAEFKAACEADKQRALLDLKHKSEMEKEQAVQETKKKQWCAYCQKEAQLYCCWNTAYCSYACQQSHWVSHLNSCLNKDHNTPGPDVAPRVPPPRAPFNPAPGQMHVPDAWVESESENVQSTKEKIRRKRCGVCQGCLTKPCGDCHACNTPKSHVVCKNRRCSFILTKGTEMASGHSTESALQPPPPPWSAPPQPQYFVSTETVMTSKPRMNERDMMFHPAAMPWSAPPQPQYFVCSETVRMEKHVMMPPSPPRGRFRPPLFRQNGYPGRYSVGLPSRYPGPRFRPGPSFSAGPTCTMTSPPIPPQFNHSPLPIYPPRPVFNSVVPPSQSPLYSVNLDLPRPPRD